MRCTYDPQTRGGSAPDGRKVKATIHWVAAGQALTAEARLYEHLFTKEVPDDVEEGKEWTDYLNPDSVEVIPDFRIETSVAGVAPGTRFQFERQGYFCVDADSSEDHLVFNRTVPLRDSWAKIKKR